MRSVFAVFAVFAALFSVTTPLDAQVVRMEVDQRAPFAGGHSFARTGPYEKIVGRLYIEVDPRDPANARVHDLRLAPTNDRGRVEVWTDFFLLKPADPARGNRRLLYDVANRGNKVALGSFNGGGGNDPSTLEHAGDGFLMEEGYSILWSGWSGDVEPGNDRVQIGVPIARNEDGSSIVGRIYAEIEATVYGLYVANVLEPGSDAATRRFHSLPFDWGSSRPYPSVTTDNANATLVKRPHRDAEGVEIPRDQWRFGRMEDGGVVVPDPNWVYLEAGFEPGWLYDLVYEGKDPRVTGLGLAATRDVISFFRYASDEEGPRANPLAGTVEYAYGYGGSQSGRFLHHFVYEGFNADLEGRLVFDAVMPHVAGAGKGIFNHRFGQTTRHGSHHEEKLYPSDFFPFNSVHRLDPVTGASGSMLDRARASGHVPRIFFTQTSTEYWSRAASLLQTDVEGKVDAELDPSVRIYMIAGTAHNSMTGGVYQSPVNRATTRPVLRALLVALDRWVTEGAEPPRSRYPPHRRRHARRPGGLPRRLARNSGGRGARRLLSTLPPRSRPALGQRRDRRPRAAQDRAGIPDPRAHDRRGRERTRGDPAPARGGTARHLHGLEPPRRLLGSGRHAHPVDGVVSHLSSDRGGEVKAARPPQVRPGTLIPRTTHTSPRSRAYAGSWWPTAICWSETPRRGFGKLPSGRGDWGVGRGLTSAIAGDV